MPGFSNFDQLIEAETIDLTLQKIPYNKLLPSATTAGVMHTYWKSTGIPAAGSDPANGMAGAAACSNATTGALLYANPSAPATLHIVGFDCMSPQAGTLYLFDRLAHANIDNNQATASFSPVIDGTARLDSGEGAMIIMEVTSALSAATNVRTFTYTNQAGTGSRTTGNLSMAASAIVGRVPYANFVYVPLQAGDTGVRSIESTTLVSGTATGVYNVVLVKPIASVAVPAANLMGQKEFVVEIPNLARIKDNSCLFFMWAPAATATTPVLGEVRFLAN